MTDFPTLTTEQARQWRTKLTELRAAAGMSTDARLVARLVERLAQTDRIRGGEPAEAKAKSTLQKEFSEFGSATHDRLERWFDRRDNYEGVIDVVAELLRTDAERLRFIYLRLAEGTAGESLGGGWHPSFAEVRADEIFVEPHVTEPGGWFLSDHKDASPLEALERTIREKVRPGSRPVTVHVSSAPGGGASTVADRLANRLRGEAEFVPSNSLGGSGKRFAALRVACRVAGGEVVGEAEPQVEIRVGGDNANADLRVALPGWGPAQLRQLCDQLACCASLGRQLKERVAQVALLLADETAHRLPPLTADVAIRFVRRLAEDLPADASSLRDFLVASWVPAPHVAGALAELWYGALAHESNVENWDLRWDSQSPADEARRYKLELIHDEARGLAGTRSARLKDVERNTIAERIVKLAEEGDVQLVFARAVECGALLREGESVKPVDSLLARVLVARHSDKVGALPFAEGARWWLRPDADLLAREFGAAGFPAQTFFAATESLPAWAWVERTVVEIAFAAGAQSVDGAEAAFTGAWATLLQALVDAIPTPDPASPDSPYSALLSRWRDPFAGLPESVASRTIEALTFAGVVHAAVLPRLSIDGATAEVAALARARLPELGAWLGRVDVAMGSRRGAQPQWACSDVWRRLGQDAVRGAPGELVVAQFAPLQCIDLLVHHRIEWRFETAHPRLWSWIDRLAAAGDHACRQRLLGTRPDLPERHEEDLNDRLVLDWSSERNIPWALRAKWIAAQDDRVARVRLRWLLEEAIDKETRGWDAARRGPLVELLRHFAGTDVGYRRLRAVTPLVGGGSPSVSLEAALALGAEAGVFGLHREVAALGVQLLEGVQLRRVDGWMMLEATTDRDWQHLQSAFERRPPPRRIARVQRGKPWGDDATGSVATWFAIVWQGALAAEELARNGDTAPLRAVVTGLRRSLQVGLTEAELEYTSLFPRARKQLYPFEFGGEPETKRLLGELPEPRSPRLDLTRELFRSATAAVSQRAETLLLQLDESALGAALAEEEPPRALTDLIRQDAEIRERVAVATIVSKSTLTVALHATTAAGSAEHPRLRLLLGRAPLDVVAQFAWETRAHPELSHALKRLEGDAEPGLRDVARCLLVARGHGGRLEAALIRSVSELLGRPEMDLRRGIEALVPRESANSFGLSTVPGEWRVAGPRSHLAALVAAWSKSDAKPSEEAVRLARRVLRAYSELVRDDGLDVGASTEVESAAGVWLSADHLWEGWMDALTLRPRDGLGSLIAVAGVDWVWQRLRDASVGEELELGIEQARAVHFCLTARFAEHAGRDIDQAVREGDIEQLRTLMQIATAREDRSAIRRIAAWALERAGVDPTLETLERVDFGYWIYEVALVFPDRLLESMRRWGVRPEFRPYLCSLLSQVVSFLAWTDEPQAGEFRALYREWLITGAGAAAETGPESAPKRPKRNRPPAG